MSYSYAISGVMDVDQRWDALPGDGAMYCVPAAFVNWMYYFATHGRLTALPFVNGQANHIRRNIAAMGDYMDTDAQDGTSTSDAIDGLVDWSEDRNVPYLVMSARATDTTTSATPACATSCRWGPTSSSAEAGTSWTTACSNGSVATP